MYSANSTYTVEAMIMDKEDNVIFNGSFILNYYDDDTIAVPEYDFEMAEFSKDDFEELEKDFWVELHDLGVYFINNERIDTAPQVIKELLAKGYTFSFEKDM